MKTIIKYDGSFEGLLTTIFHIYEQKLKLVSIENKKISTENFFDKSEIVVTDSKKANRVWKGLSKKISASAKRKIYKTYLSELPYMENTILEYVRLAMVAEKNIEKDFSNTYVLEIEKIVKKIDREKHRMDAFVRFRLTRDGIYFATIEPDFNVLPLNADHFKKRYADQKWIIYDVKRNYGVYYDLEKIEMVEMDLSNDVNLKSSENLYFSFEEFQFQELWGNYFKSTNIASRKNMKLHIKHVPKRYWKYLSEKNC
ncbi:TIGR03915 family putative DNA repair protein [Aequorivita echinoideorum]|uniref:TIGR03915 family putative DNA repair protein n=1 Tax=Aequorivita echinoideorum TaxID=1549647 RepID=A0ABS5S329_9FLAO|nr:TIGR03915 family putative DNA repair protein [Aequorivita echinoideorum]MBT0607601.1 TIGR03915 family putative DNA repair protein [Aequorivita echinoideorum]